MRVKTVEDKEYTGVYLPSQAARHVLDALREAEPELAEVRVAGGEVQVQVPAHSPRQYLLWHMALEA